MTEKQKSKSWRDMSAAEKKAVVIGWAVILVVAGYFLIPADEGKPVPESVTAAVVSAAPAEIDPAIYTKPSVEALARATQYLAELDKAMNDGAVVLKTGDPTALGAHSKHFTSLVENGKAQFGNMTFEPLGRCFGAGNDARNWWHAQLGAASRGGTESAPGWIKRGLDDYQVSRAECLKSADPVASAAAEAELDASLQEKFGGGRECLTTYDLDANTKQVVALPKPAHCKI
ncbi:MAG: hypothetical protein Q8R10_14185 [Pseudomonas sp.]|uniref:hypothetical protein n=1 Tax=Pseudomonas sp. TaxID=306 RepID=UPI002735F43A|nr:hypothetical protein [Pseudomonas sp.]MDP3847563.1 hypothetical protein [Pseudomonas sp.]